MPEPINVLTCSLSQPLAAALDRTLADRATLTAFEGDCRDVQTCRDHATASVVVIQLPREGDPVDRIDAAWPPERGHTASPGEPSPCLDQGQLAP